MMVNIIKKIEPRIVYAAMIATIFIFLLASYMFFFKKPILEYSTLQQNKILLQAKINGGKNFSVDIERLKDEVNQLTKRLYGEKSVQFEREMFAHTIDKLDNISLCHNINLLSVKPSSPRIIPMFKKTSFDVEIAGGYKQLYQWLHEMEQEFDSMVVERFDIRPWNLSRTLHMKIKLVSYRPTRE